MNRAIVVTAVTWTNTETDFVNNWVMVYLIPANLVNENGSQLLFKFFSVVTVRFEVGQLTIAAYCPKNAEFSQKDPRQYFGAPRAIFFSETNSFSHWTSFANKQTSKLPLPRPDTSETSRQQSEARCNYMWDNASLLTDCWGE